jgi:hypothetical protein
MHSAYDLSTAGAKSLPLPLWERIASPHEPKTNAWARLVRGELSRILISLET